MKNFGRGEIVMITVKHTCILLLLLSGVVFSQSGQSATLVAIGDKADQEQVYVPAMAKEGPDGNIYIMDAKDSFIKIYTPNGDFLRKIGGTGFGPGLMARRGSFGFSDAYTLFFTELINGNRWITFMKLSGKLDRVLKLNISGQFGVWRAVILPDGRVLAEINKWGEYEKRGNLFVGYYLRWLAIINKEGKIDHIPIHRNQVFSISQSPSEGDCRIPFFPEFLWRLNKQNNILYSDGASNIFQVIDLVGNHGGKIETPLPNGPPVTEEDLDEWRNEKKTEVVKRQGNEIYAKHFSFIEKYTSSIHRQKPIYSDFDITPEENLLVEGYLDEKTRQRKYWLVDKSGKLLKEITTTNIISISITKRYIIYIKENEDEENRVYCLARKGKEKDDLNAKSF